MARRQKLKLRTPPNAQPAAPVGRILAGLGVLVGLGLVVLQLGDHLLDDGTAQADPAPEAALTPASEVRPELHLRALENLRARVEIDGQVVFEGVVSGGTDRTWTAGAVTALELQDLTRATIHYDGQRVQPLGSLTTARRLEFIDDL